MLNGILDIILGIVDAIPAEAIATVAVLVGGAGLILTGWRYLVSGALAFFAALNAALNALINLFQGILSAFGFAVGGLIILSLGLLLIRSGLILLGLGGG